MFAPGDRVWLCGIAVPHDLGLVGHSDADVGMHALTDAIYGALAEGDIGRHFPPSDPQWKGAASDRFLRHAVEILTNKGGQIINADVIADGCSGLPVGPVLDQNAAAQAAQAGCNPMIIRIDTKAGHGAGKPTAKQIEEVADRWGFLSKALKM